MTADRVFIRFLTANDATEQYEKWMNSPRITRFLESRWRSHSRQDIAEYIQSVNRSNSDFLFGIFESKSGKHVGNVKISELHPIHRFASIGMLIGEEEVQGKGFATEGIRLATNYAFHELNTNKLIAGVYEGNEASKRVFEKCGYKLVGCLKAHRFLDNRFVDQYLMEIVNPKSSGGVSR